MQVFFLIQNSFINFLKGFEATDIPYDSQITNYDVMYAWSTDHCTPLVREITFENAEVIQFKSF